MAGGAHHPGVGLDDAGFFGGDLLDGVAEKIFVIEINLRDDGDFGSDDVGGIQAAAHAHFEDGDVHFLLREITERPWR